MRGRFAVPTTRPHTSQTNERNLNLKHPAHMRTLASFLAGTFLSSGLFAQVIQQSMLPTATVSLTHHYGGVFMDDSASGIDATWTVTGSSAWQLPGSFGPVSGNPFAEYFPAAEYVFTYQPNGTSSVPHEFMDATSSELALMGYLVDNGFPPYYDTTCSPSRKLLAFPMGMGDSFTNSWSEPNDPFPPMTVTQTWTYVGNGTLTTPWGTFQNVVKLESSGGQVALWNTAPLHPLYFHDGFEGRIFVPADGGTGIPEAVATGFHVAPNPAHALMTLMLAGPGQARYLTLLDATGRVVWERSIANVTGPITVDLSGHDNGLYFVHVLFADGMRAVERVVKE